MYRLLSNNILSPQAINLERILKMQQARKIKLTQAQLADIIGAMQKDVSRWEQGVVKPNTDTLIKLSQALECTVDELI